MSMLILEMVLIDIYSHRGHIWNQLILENKTDGKILVEVMRAGSNPRESIIFLGGK